MQEKILNWCVCGLFISECFFLLFLPSSDSRNTRRDRALHFTSNSNFIHLPPPLSHLLCPRVSVFITLWFDLFILSITVLLSSPPSRRLHNIFHLITGRSAGVVGSLVCWGVRCKMGSQTCNPPGFLSALHIWQRKQTKHFSSSQI